MTNTQIADALRHARTTALLSMFALCACSAPQTVAYEDFFNEFGSSVAGEYRLPSGADLSYWGSDTNTVFYKSIDDEGTQKPPYWTKGDFNRDGVTDRAYLLFKNSDSSVSLFAFVSRKEGGYDVVLVEPDGHLTMGVSTHVLSSGEPVINLFRFEGEGVASYIWRDTTKSFEALEEVWSPFE